MQYEEGGLWHERLLLCRSRGSSWAIMTPDGDIYVEDLRAQPFFLVARDNSLPRTLAGVEVYRFGDMRTIATNAEWR